MRIYRREGRPPRPDGHEWVIVRQEGDFYGNVSEEWGYWYSGSWALAHNNPNTVQAAFVAVNDDGNITGATENAAGDNGNWTQEVDSIFRVRFQITENGGADESAGSYVLRYSTDDATYSVVTGSTPVQFADSTNVTDGIAITSGRLGTVNVNGEYDENGTVGSLTLTANNSTEMEYCLTIDSAQVANNDPLYLRVYRDTTALDGYTNYPTITVSEATPDALLANDVESASEVSSPVIGQVHALTNTSVESASEVSAPAITEINILTAASVESASELSTPTASESNILTATSIQSTSEVTAPVIGQVHVIQASSAESASEVSAPVIAQIHQITVSHTESASEVSAPALGVGAGTDELLADDIESSSEVGAPALTVIYGLLATSVESQSAVSMPTLDREQSNSGSSHPVAHRYAKRKQLRFGRRS